MIREFSPNQKAIFGFVKNGKGNLIIEAVAGSGKTTTLVEAIKLMMGNVSVFAFNKKMGDELKERTKGMARVHAGTFHSAGFSALRYWNKHVKIDVNDKKVNEIADELIKGYPEYLHDMVGSAISITKMAKQRGIGALTVIDNYDAWYDMIDHFGLADDIPEDISEQQVVEFAIKILRRSNEIIAVVDYHDMIYLPLLKKLKLFQSDWILVDEAQDTNPVRRAFAAKMLKPGGRFIAVGDPRQAIFGFTGADNNALDQIQEQFKCIKLPLSVSYRCPQNVVNHAKQWVSHIEASPTAPKGVFGVVEYNNMEKMVNVGDAIVCRFNKYLVNLCFKFIRNGIPAKMEGRNIGEGLVKLCSKWKIKDLAKLEVKLLDYKEAEIQKAIDKGDESRADVIIDKVDTIIVLMDRAREQKIYDVEGFKQMIMDLFEDNAGTKKPCVILSSVHKSKGLEWSKVFILGREQFMPSSMARTAWQEEQELNLIYVAITRAKEELYEVIDVPEIDINSKFRKEQAETTTTGK